MQMRKTDAMTSHDPVYHPAHYESNSRIQTIEILETVIDGLPAKQAYLLGNIIKYVIRAGRKGDITEDLAKANNYAHRLVTGKWREQAKNRKNKYK